MGLVAEFAFPPEAFALGDALRRDGVERIEFVCNVPSRAGVVPYCWVRGSSFDGFEDAVRGEPAIRDLSEVDALERSRLYRTEWRPTGRGLLSAVRASDALLRSAAGEDHWEFEIVFDERDSLTAFSDRCSELGLSFELQYVHSLRRPTEEDYGLTPVQRRTLIRAEEEGHFEEPRKLTVEELAAEMDLSPTAVSGRLRRGVSNLIRRTILSTE
ncbi:helix-turn-helix domain-containing protein [Haloplanus halophilus]|uniref:helix-turn-helix domain-containing protein n=1 Tax=Haloplanus halophilus TaxID=2949993 RepID=UPI00203F6D13|nr:helix-turn-helix domain-containing protein [Haloplanus sp. GDY1]